MHFVPLYTAQRQQLHSVHINAAWIKCQGHFLVAFSCCCCCSAATAGDDATCFSQTVARFMLRPPHPPAAACWCPAACPCEVMLSCLRVCECVCLKMRCNIQVSDVNASRTQRTNKQTDSRSRERVKGRERQTESDCSGAWSKSSWPAGRRAMGRRSGGQLCLSRWMPYHRTENGVKTSAEAQLKPPSSLSPFLLAVLLGLPPRVVILVNYESCSPAPSATGPNARHACRHCALPPLPPLTSPWHAV